MEIDNGESLSIISDVQRKDLFPDVTLQKSSVPLFEHLHQGTHPCPGTAECQGTLWSATDQPVLSSCGR